MNGMSKRIALILFLALFASISQPVFTRAQTAETSAPSTDQQRQELEAQLAELEKEQEAFQAQIDQYQKQGSSLSNEIATLNAKINKIKTQIQSVNLTLTKLGTQITETQKGINQTENQINTNREALGKSVQTLYESDKEGLLVVLMRNQKLSDFFGDVTDVILVQNNVQIALQEIEKLRQNLVEQKEELTAEKEDAENMRAIQLAQQKSAAATQAEKNNLLKATKGKESEYQKLLKANQAKAAEIRNRIFELLGGGSLTFEKAYDYAAIAEKATGVRAALILSILSRESLLGKNVGQCSYTTAMHPTRDIPYFLDLTKRLGIDPNSDAAKVSCPIVAHGSYGGAMGPAQFIPSTWKIYEEKIAAVTGHNPPSPWNNADAFSATGVYIKDLLESASCVSYAKENQSVVSYQTLLERCAAAKYYSGGNWYKYRFFYGDPVVTQANEFEKDIAILKDN